METMEKLDLKKYGLPSGQPFDPVAYGKMKADSYNQTEGDLTGMDCKKCLNRGRIAHPKEDGNLAFAECTCMKSRRSIWKMEKSGLKNVIRDMTFERFQTTVVGEERSDTEPDLGTFSETNIKVGRTFEIEGVGEEQRLLHRVST